MIREELGSSNIYFSPEFLREGTPCRQSVPVANYCGGNDDACHEFALRSHVRADNCPIVYMGRAKLRR